MRSLPGHTGHPLAREHLRSAIREAVPVEQWDKERYRQYLREFRDHSFSGNSSHIERNHLIAEAAVMCMGAGIQADPLAIPKVMEPQIRKLQPEQASFYFARDLKRVNEYELNKIRFTRLAGAIVYPGGMYPVYNIRSQMPRWMGDGELKIRLHLHSTSRPCSITRTPCGRPQS